VDCFVGRIVLSVLNGSIITRRSAYAAMNDSPVPSRFLDKGWVAYLNDAGEEVREQSMLVSYLF
jgi:hypothetical protein